MPDKKKPNYNDADFQKFLEQMKIIGVSESGNNYNATNPNPGQTATGKYQYNKSHLPEIKKFSKEIGMPVDSLEQFKNNPGLQEAYFAHDQYKAYEWAKNKITNKNPFNYNLAELAALRHFQGEGGANDILTSGKHTKASKINPSTKSYIEGTFRKNLVNAGLYANSGEEKNNLKANSTDAKTKQQIQAQYEKELKTIKAQKFDALTENSMVNNLNQKYFDAGNLEMVNRKIDYRNNQENGKLGDKYKNIKGMADEFLGYGTQKGGTFISGSSKNDQIGDSAKQRLAKLAKQFGEKPEAVLIRNKEADSAFDFRDYYKIDPTTKTGQFLINPNVETLRKQLPESKKTQRIQLSQYEKPAIIADVEDITPEQEELLNDSVAPAAMVNPQRPAITIPSAVDAPKTTYDNSEVMGMFSSNEIAPDQQFQYKAGSPKIPWEAAGYLMAGLEGVKAGNVDIPMRTEEVSPVMRNYAAKLKQIAEMGLDPATEGDLKNKLASFYQTGLTNIVRASAGNRNLVLGNQGQLDQNRTQGLIDIATMDIQRRDKALGDYGEVVKYMDAFYANRDIANNERMYREAEKKQIAGSQLAQQGFGALIDSIKYMKENGPNSPNDMMSQYLMYSVSGVNPGIDDDMSGTIPGTQSYVDAQRTVQNGRKDERQKMKDFYIGSSKEDKENFNKFLFENEHLNPTVNKDVTFDQIKSEYDKATGVPEAKQAIADSQGVISLSNDQLNNPASTQEAAPKLGPNPATDYFDFGATQRTATKPAVTSPVIQPLLPGTPAIIQQANIASQPVAVNDTQAAQERLAKAIQDSTSYLSTTGQQTNNNLDSMIKLTEEQTKKMSSQIKSPY